MRMKYIDVTWLHSNEDDPVRLVSEIGADGYECRKLEFWSNGCVGYASKSSASRATALGEFPVPPISEINSDGQFLGTEIDASKFEQLWTSYVTPGVPHIECSITFVPTNEGGRSAQFPPGALSGDQYRPHLVIGEFTQQQGVLRGNRVTEEYIGIAFHSGPTISPMGTEITAVLSLMYYPNRMYEELQPGVTFTIREGARTVGYGIVLRWLY